MCFLTEAHRPLDLHGFFTSWKLPEGAQKHPVLNRHSESVWLAVPMQFFAEWISPSGICKHGAHLVVSQGGVRFHRGTRPRALWLVSDRWSTSCSRSSHYLPGSVMLANPLPSLTWGVLLSYTVFLLQFGTLTTSLRWNVVARFQQSPRECGHGVVSHCHLRCRPL